MLAEQVHAPLSLYLDCEGVDQLHDVDLTHLFLSLRPVLFLFSFFGFGDTRAGESAIGSGVMAVAFEFALNVFLFLFGDFGFVFA